MLASTRCRAGRAAAGTKPKETQVNKAIGQTADGFRLCAMTAASEVVSRSGPAPGRCKSSQRPDGRRGIRWGVVLAGRVDGHIAEDEPVALGSAGRRSCSLHGIAREAGRPAEADGAGLFAQLAASSGGGRASRHPRGVAGVYRGYGEAGVTVLCKVSAL